MGIPRVAIVGRPNVGKSSILNWLARKRVSVVDPTAGVTRDRVAYLLREKGRLFELIDTGGMGIVDSDQLSEQIERQIDVALAEADLIVFVVDGQAGVVPLDCEVADRLRKVEDPKLLVVNKCDSTRPEREAAEFPGPRDAPLVITRPQGNRHRPARRGRAPAAPESLQASASSKMRGWYWAATVRRLGFSPTSGFGGGVG